MLWKSKISLNAIISVFATISKSALLVPVTACVSQLKWRHFEYNARALKEMDVFDRSSRGPLGALELLMSVNWRAPVASIGAGIILLALAIDPFTQQILEFPVRTVPVSVGNGSAVVQAAFQVSNVYNWSAGVNTGTFFSSSTLIDEFMETNNTYQLLAWLISRCRAQLWLV
jgi:Protein of unknown function (DUF3176)